MITRLVKASAEATVAVGPTSTLVLELDVRNDEQIVVQMTNLSAGQVLSAEVHRKTTTGTEYAELAADYAEQMGGDARQKLQHALGMFKRLDLADNKRADYSDSEARMAIEAELGKRARS